MSQAFDSPLAFAEHLVLLEAMVAVELKEGLTHVLKVLKRDMIAQVGHYQDEAGPYGAWQPLTTATEAEKARLGAPANAPLERTGELKKSFHYETKELEGVVGSTDPVMFEHEFGTNRAPPRPVVGPALYKNREAVQAIVGHALLVAIAGRRVAHELVTLSDYDT